MLLLINVIAEYCVRAEEITLSVKCLLRYVTELLQLFNRKSCKLVLGGEAVSEKTGLKMITSSNLALLMRALQLILKLVPLIKKHFLSMCLLIVFFQLDIPYFVNLVILSSVDLLPDNSKAAVTCLDRVCDELRLHIKDISNKLLSIPSQIIATELKNWEAKPPVPSKSFQNLSR